MCAYVYVCACASVRVAACGAEAAMTVFDFFFDSAVFYIVISYIHGSFLPNRFSVFSTRSFTHTKKKQQQ